MPVFIVYFALLAVAFFFLIVRPQRRQLAARRALIQAVHVGDEIITAGGIHGFVREADQMEVRLEIAEGVVVRLDRRAVAAVAEDVPVVDEEDETDVDPRPDQEDQAEESLKG